MGIRADFRGFPYPAPSDGRSAELEAFEWLLETYRAELSQLFDLGRRQPVDDAARTVKGKLSHDPDHRTTLGICRQRFDIIYTLKPSTKHTSDPISRPAGHDPKESSADAEVQRPVEFSCHSSRLPTDLN